MNISFIINCEYWEDDSSRYRLALMKELLVPSLRTETLSDVNFWLRQCPMDPRWTARREALEFLGRRVKHVGEHPPWDVAKKFRPIIEIRAPDDVAFVPGFLDGFRSLAQRTTQNVTVKLPCGLLYDGGKYREVTGAGVTVRILVEETAKTSTFRELRKVAWCVAKHQMNDPWVDELNIGVLSASSIPSVCDATLGRYCRLQIKTGTAAGATREWHRGRSMILGRNFRGRRSP